MDKKAWTACQACAHVVSGVVIYAQVKIERGGDAGIQIAHEGEELLVAMARLAFGRRWKCQGRQTAMWCRAESSHGDAFNVTQANGHHRLAVVQCFDLTLLIDTKNQSVVRRVEIKSDDVAVCPMNGSVEIAKLRVRCGFTTKIWNSRCMIDFEIPLHYRLGRTLQCVPAVGLPDSVRQQSSNLFVLDTSRPPGTPLIVESGQTMLKGTLSPPTDGRLAKVQTFGSSVLFIPCAAP